MTENIHNIYISSLNKNGNKTNYNYNIYLSNYNINIKPDEEAYLNITGFQTLNTFYNINSNSNTFSIRVRTAQDIIFTYNFTIDQGNYNVYEFMNEINKIAGTYINITYNEKKNRYIYKSLLSINDLLYLKPTKYNYKYFGLVADEYTAILTGDVAVDNRYSDIINMNNWSIIVIKVIGLIEVNKTLDNFNNNQMIKGDISAIINRQDTAVNALINWNDINKSFQKKINNNEINYLNFQFYNEYNDILTDLNDWLITLRIIIKKNK